MAPTITSKFSSVSITEGEPFELALEASGKPVPTISWFKDGKQIIDTSKFQFLAGQGKSVLKVDKATLDMAGMFSVKVTNKAGEVEEKVKVTIGKGGITFTQHFFIK